MNYALRARCGQSSWLRACAWLLLFLLPTGCGDDHAPSHDEDGAGHASEDSPAHDEDEVAHADEDDHDHEAEHPEGQVVLSQQQFESAGIEVQEVGAGEFRSAITLAATVVPDADAVTHVNPKVPGLVREVRFGLGDHVEAGDSLCVIESVELGAAVSDYLRDRALLESAGEALTRELELFDERIAATTSVLDAAIEANRRIHEQERALREQELSTMRPLLEAERDLDAARLEKARRLVELRAQRDARRIVLEREVRESEIALQAARNRLQSLGVDLEQHEPMSADSPLASGVHELHAARSGIVMTRHITEGEYVDRATQLFVLEDLSRVWLLGSAFESQLSSIRSGSPAEIRLDAFPGRVFTGSVNLVGYRVDLTSRSLPIRIELENAPLDDWEEAFPVRPGMFGRVDIEVTRRSADVTMPEAALVHEDRGDFVFVQVAPRSFERRAVEAVEGVGGVCEVLSGLEPGEHIVVRGTFLLKSAARSEELGGGHSH